jgi:hypothetical protein
MADEKDTKAPPQRIKVRNLIAPDEDSVASMGDLQPIEFTKGIAEMDEDTARALHHASPQFELVDEATPTARATKAAPAAKEETTS